MNSNTKWLVRKVLPFLQARDVLSKQEKGPEKLPGPDGSLLTPATVLREAASDACGGGRDDDLCNDRSCNNRSGGACRICGTFCG